MNPVISIVVPVYNVEAYIGNCIDSILAQTFTDVEVIIVNDGSADNSGMIADAYSRKDSRVKVIHQESGGVSAARNTGVRTARGQYIGFVDGDDYINRNMYENLYKLCTETKSDIAVCHLGREINGRFVSSGNQQTLPIELTNEEAMRELFKGKLFRFSLCNKLFKQSCFDGVTFPEGRIHEDLSATYRLFAHAEKVVYENFTGYVYVKRNNSILTTTFHEGRLDAYIGWNEIVTFMDNHYKQLLPDVYACYGYWCVDNMYDVLNQITDRKEKKLFLMKIRMYSNPYYKHLMGNNLLSLKYKCIMSMIRYNIYVLLWAARLKRVLPN